MSYEGLHPSFAQAILQIANGQAIAPPGDGWAVRLYENLFSSVGVATELVTGTSAGYLPAEVGASPSYWSDPSGRQCSNASPVLFPINSSLTVPWKSAVSVAIGKKTGSVSTLPEVCYFGKLDTSWANPPGDRLRYPIGRLLVKMFASNTCISEAFAHKILGLLKGAGITPPNTLYVGLGKDTPDPLTGSFGEVAELARVPIAATAGKWVAGATVRDLQNAENLEFMEAPEGLPKIKSFGVFDEPRSAGVAPTLSGQYWHGLTTSDKVLYFEDIVTILASGITLSL